MFIKHKKRHKPLYKQFLKLRTNVQRRKKLLKFKRKKWDRIVQQYKRQLRRYKKFKPRNQNRYIVSRYPRKNTSYQKRFRNTLNATRKFRLFYGNLTKKFLKKQISTLLNKKKSSNLYSLFLKKFENRLDTVLYKSKFCISLRNARQLILHCKVFVNKRPIKSPSYMLKPGDLISVNPNCSHLIEKNLKNSQIWLIPPKHLVINYKTMEIIIGNNEHVNESLLFPFDLGLEQVLVDYSYN